MFVLHSTNQTNCYRRLTETNSLLNDVLEAVRPHVNLTFDNILAHINTIYVLKTKSGALAGQGYLRLKVSQYNYFQFSSQVNIFFSFQKHLYTIFHIVSVSNSSQIREDLISVVLVGGGFLKYLF